MIHQLLFHADVTLRLLGSDDFAPTVKAEAAARLSEALVDGGLRIAVTEQLSLDEVARAHELVEAGHVGRVVLAIA
jgi:NADPH2:quinone reductase